MGKRSPPFFATQGPPGNVMLPSVIIHPELRCIAHARRSGWQQCGRLAAYGSKVCTSHGARKIPRFGTDAPNYRHGERSLEAITEARHARERVRVLALGVAALDGSEAAACAFQAAWLCLMERQAQELVALQEKISRRR